MRSMHHKILGVVLAGGKSSRMGQNKSQLMFNGISLLEHANDALKQAGCHHVIISGQDGLPDDTPHLGPLGGVSTIIKHNKTPEIFLFLPVDMPYLQSQYLKNLIDILLENKEIETAFFKGSPLPFSLRNTQLTIPNRGSIKAFLAPLMAKILFAPSSYLSNINTPQQWQTFLDKEERKNEDYIRQ